MEPRTEYQLLNPRVSSEARFLSWNVYYGDTPAHGSEVIIALKRFDCDVLALYELNCALGLPEKIHKLGYGGVFVEANYRRWLLPLKGGIALYSRFPIEEYRIVKTISDGLLCVRRHYIEARLRISESFSMTVGMIHNTLPFEAGYAGACDALFREVAKHKERFLLGTDLNAMPSFDIVRRLSSQLEHLGPPFDQPSHPMSRWLKRFTPQRRLDYVFGTKDIGKMLVEPAKFGESHPSDHSPLIVHLRTNK